MLIGADGVDSLVRRQLMEGEVNSQYGGCVVMSGVTRIHVPPMDVPDVFPNGIEIPDLSKQDVYNFCPEGQAKSVVGGGVAFGVLPLGNGMIAWNLITSQDVPGKLQLINIM
jgi:2-polyprenyl-6-methoxyphenol hydroxylase-like FAD-dependent oxidoreductase